MTLFQALAKSEEMNCRIINRVYGVKLKAKIGMRLTDLPPDGWELDDEIMPVTFQAEYMGTPHLEGIAGDATALLFRGKWVLLMAKGTKVKVTLEPIDS